MTETHNVTERVNAIKEWKETISFLPRKCELTGKSIWLRSAYVGHHPARTPWDTEDEYTIWVSVPALVMHRLSA